MTTYRTTPINLNQLFTFEGDELCGRVSYKVKEMMDVLRVDPKYLTDTKLQYVCEVLGCNVDGDYKFTFSECREEMIRDLLEHVYTT